MATEKRGLGHAATDPLTKLGEDIKQSTSSKQSNNSKPSTTKKGLPEGWSRATFIVRDEYLEKIKAIGYWDRKQIKEVLDEAITEHLKGRKVRAIPTK
jgi:hypothetical protein